MTELQARREERRATEMKLSVSRWQAAPYGRTDWCLTFWDLPFEICNRVEDTHARLRLERDGAFLAHRIVSDPT